MKKSRGWNMRNMRQRIELINKQDFLMAEDHSICYPTKYCIDIEKFDSLPTVDVNDMMVDIYMKGVNMTGEYQGCWVRYKDIEEIVEKYISKTQVKGTDA